jgi:phosphoribosyl 1,2-cyclic phosphodiesterase
MSLRFSILASGSSGNCALLQSEGARVLIDAGFSPRRLKQMLHEAGTSFEAIDAVFLTHEHGDHAAGIEGLDHRAAWNIFETGNRFSFRDLEVASFAVPHDAQDPVGFTFASGRDGDLFAPRRALAWLTDLGHAPGHIHERLRDVDVVVVEANHCPKLLQADLKRPWPTKQRIAGRHGHLSNEAMRELLESVASPRWRHVFLTHVSRDCNSHDAIEATLSPLRSRLHCGFSIVAPGGGTPFFELG